jgi:uncharacterized RDD family membrane protein YckC
LPKYPEMDNITSPDLLQDIELEQFQYEDASTGIRLANYLIDSIVFVILFLAFIYFTALVTQSNAIATSMNELPVLVERLLWLMIIAIYYALVEGFSKGRSMGKLITGTKTVRWDNQPFGWGDALGRGFSRVVPFEPLSALWGNPWHDKWTNTRVVKVR